MPLGWYLAQGLIPLGPSSSDDEEGPCELPNGRLVCGPHGYVTCNRCCTDYSFMEEDLANSDNEDDDDPLMMDTREAALMPIVLSTGYCAVVPPEDSPRNRTSPSSAGAATGTLYDRQDDDSDVIPDLYPGTAMLRRIRGTGRVFPTRFIAPSPTVTPTELFASTTSRGPPFRYVHRHDPRVMLLLADGACLDNGRPNPQAGWAFVYGSKRGEPAVTSRRLESKGPFGDLSVQSSNRAELRAVIAALRFRNWASEAFKTLVIATDSEYVSSGATSWAQTWVRNGWLKHRNEPVKNKDLWEMLLGEVEKWHDRGLRIQFWRIPREWNTVADAAAKIAAEQPIEAEWKDVV